VPKEDVRYRYFCAGIFACGYGLHDDVDVLLYVRLVLGLFVFVSSESNEARRTGMYVCMCKRVREREQRSHDLRFNIENSNITYPSSDPLEIHLMFLSLCKKSHEQSQDKA